MKAGSAVDSDPVDGNTYTANTAFGAGAQIGIGNFVIYANNGSSVNVTGLTVGITYHIAVYEYNAGAAGTENYMPIPARGSRQASDATLVDLISFEAIGMEDRVSITWKTAAEPFNVGFNLWRSQGSDYSKINSSLIPAQGDAVTGASYSHEDYDITLHQSYSYKLEDIDASGVGSFHGPVAASPGVTTLLSPENGASVPDQTATIFIWDSPSLDRFRLELSKHNDFSKSVLTVPARVKKGKKKWITETFYTPTSTEWKSIRKTADRKGGLYRRIYGENGDGAGYGSNANHMKIQKTLH